MNRFSPILSFFFTLVFAATQFPGARIYAKEFLTPEEIEKVQFSQEIDARIKAYIEAAEMRLKMARERFGGLESQEGAPLEFFSVAEMIEGYNSIIQSVMMNLEDAYQNKSTDREKLRAALTLLRDSAKNAENALTVLKKMAEERLDEKVGNQVNQAIEMTKDALEGAESGLSELPVPAKKKRGADER
jgi:hypothetical protein